MNIGIGLAFQTGYAAVAYGFGIILIPLQLIVISTHFCAASWMFEGLMRLLGRWTPPISGERAKELVREGAQLVDVREPDEFDSGHLPDAINLPLDTIDGHLDTLRQKPAILYCLSGLRSQTAYTQLKKHDMVVHNLGGMDRYGDND